MCAQHGAFRVVAGLLSSLPRAHTALDPRESQVEGHMALFHPAVDVTHRYLCILPAEAGVRVTLGKRKGNTDPICR